MTTQNKKTVIDPVCKALLDPERTARLMRYKGKKYYFCSPGCFDAFRKENAKYGKRKGVLGRFLDRLISANEKEFGSKGPCCH